MHTFVSRCLLALVLAAGFAVLPASRVDAADLAPEDRVALLNLISAYSHEWDGGDQKGWVDLFQDDAVIQASFRGQLAWKYGSNKERANFIKGFYDNSVKIGMLQSRHFQTNTMFTAQDDGTVHSDTMFAVTFQFKGEPAPRFSNTGIYRDHFVKTKAGWKFSLRDILVDQEPPPAE
ncbi:MAG: nuclear transport factor 2 family protein [Candidatus Binatia bacterium]|nr:nuclear transport factor 2 family protein [Candidatus Binatia bacterium]